MGFAPVRSTPLLIHLPSEVTAHKSDRILFYRPHLCKLLVLQHSYPTSNTHPRTVTILYHFTPSDNFNLRVPLHRTVRKRASTKALPERGTPRPCGCSHRFNFETQVHSESLCYQHRYGLRDKVIPLFRRGPLAIVHGLSSKPR